MIILRLVFLICNHQAHLINLDKLRKDRLAGIEDHYQGSKREPIEKPGDFTPFATRPTLLSLKLAGRYESNYIHQQNP